MHTTHRLGEQSALLKKLDNISHGFFGRRGGTSPPPWRGLNTGVQVGDAPARVDENLARIRFQLGVTRRSLFAPKQVHGTRVIEVNASHAPEDVAEIEADAIITLSSGFGVGVRTADCVPILLSSSDGKLVGAIHAGWRGVVSGVVEATFAKIAGKGYSADQLIAAVGPCIGQDAFEVGPEVVAQLCESDAQCGGFITSGAGDRSYIDLKEICVMQIRLAGVENVDKVGGCTYSNPDLYFSHRFDTGRTGRQMSCVARVTPPEIDPKQYG